ncbi:hypothetical protein L873DRAFT_1167742, partial [Choiromyces venosus 120613-1]
AGLKIVWLLSFIGFYTLFNLNILKSFLELVKISTIVGCLVVLKSGWSTCSNYVHQ